MDAFLGAKSCNNVDYVAVCHAKAADHMAAPRDAGTAYARPFPGAPRRPVFVPCPIAILESLPH